MSRTGEISVSVVMSKRHHWSMGVGKDDLSSSRASVAEGAAATPSQSWPFCPENPGDWWLRGSTRAGEPGAARVVRVRNTSPHTNGQAASHKDGSFSRLSEIKRGIRYRELCGATKWGASVAVHPSGRCHRAQ